MHMQRKFAKETSFSRKRRNGQLQQLITAPSAITVSQNRCTVSFVQPQNQLVEMESGLRWRRTRVWQGRWVQKVDTLIQCIYTSAYDIPLSPALSYRNAKAYDKARDTYDRASDAYYKNHSYPHKPWSPPVSYSEPIHQSSVLSHTQAHGMTGNEAKFWPEVVAQSGASQRLKHGCDC